MDAEQLRENAHKIVDFIADYYKDIENFPVLSQVQPGYLRKLLPGTAPKEPETLKDVLDDVKEKIFPGITHWQSPNFYDYFPVNNSIAAFLGEMLISGINIVGFSWITSPAATELEMIVMDWLADLLNLPHDFHSSGQGGGVILGSASEAVLVVLLAARDKALRKNGKHALGKLVVYASDQTHSAFQKACQIAGIHPENCRFLEADASNDYALSSESLSKAISHDVASGLIPLFLCVNVGTTSSTAVDPLSALVKITKDRNALLQSLSTNPKFLKNKASETNMVIDYKDWQIALGRRFRSLKLWMVMRLYGLDNLQSYIRNHVELARHFEELVTQDPRFQVVTPRKFALVCFRLLPLHHDQDCGNKLNSDLLDAVNSSGKVFIIHTVVTPRKFALVCFRLLPPHHDQDYGNKINSDLLDAINSSGKVFIIHTVLSGIYTLRFVVGAFLTEERHVKEAWKVIQEKAYFLLKKSLKN